METWQKIQSSLNSTFKLTPEHYMVWLWELHLRQGLFRGGQHEDFLSIFNKLWNNLLLSPHILCPSALSVIAIWFFDQSVCFHWCTKITSEYLFPLSTLKYLLLLLLLSFDMGGIKANDWQVCGVLDWVFCWTGWKTAWSGFSPDPTPNWGLEKLWYSWEYSWNESVSPLPLETSWAPSICTALSFGLPRYILRWMQSDFKSN